MLGLGNGIITEQGSSEFLPTEIPGIQLWLRNNVGVARERWDDSSGNGNYATQTDTDYQADVVDGGLDFEQSDGDHYDLESAININQDQGHALFMVLTIESYDSTQNCFLSGSSSKFMEFQNEDRIRLNYTNDVTVVYFTDSGHFSVGDKFIVAITRVESGLHSVYKNGSALEIDVASSNATGVGLTNPKSSEIAYIGHRERTTADRQFDGKIHEVIIYNQTVETTDIDRILKYLKSYHGI